VVDNASAEATTTYSYDAVGNRLSLASTASWIGVQAQMYDADDRITANTHDNNGNTLVSGTRSFQYDSLDRMTSFNGGAAAMAYWLFSRNRSPFSPETDHHSPAVDQHGDVRYRMDVTGAVTDTYDYATSSGRRKGHGPASDSRSWCWAPSCAWRMRTARGPSAQTAR
jgi:hypothetical protein